MGHGGRGVTWVKHYVDDFITVGESLEECSRNVIVMQEIRDEADVPIEPGPPLDTDKIEIRLPLEQLERLKALVAS